jgi:hypothetical protein
VDNAKDLTKEYLTKEAREEDMEEEEDTMVEEEDHLPISILVR